MSAKTFSCVKGLKVLQIGNDCYKAWACTLSMVPLDSYFTQHTKAYNHSLHNYLMNISTPASVSFLRTPFQLRVSLKTCRALSGSRGSVFGGGGGSGSSPESSSLSTSNTVLPRRFLIRIHLGYNEPRQAITSCGASYRVDTAPAVQRRVFTQCLWLLVEP